MKYSIIYDTDGVIKVVDGNKFNFQTVPYYYCDYENQKLPNGWKYELPDERLVDSNGHSIEWNEYRSKESLLNFCLKHSSVRSYCLTEEKRRIERLEEIASSYNELQITLQRIKRINQSRNRYKRQLINKIIDSIRFIA